MCQALPRPHPAPCAGSGASCTQGWPRALRGSSLLAVPCFGPEPSHGEKFCVSPTTLAPELFLCLSGPVSSLWDWKLSVFSHCNEQQNLQRNIFFSILIRCLSPSLGLYLSLYVRRGKQQDLLHWCLCLSHCSGWCLGLQNMEYRRRGWEGWPGPCCHPGDPWITLEILGSPWRSLAHPEGHWITLEIIGSPWRSR